MTEYRGLDEEEDQNFNDQNLNLHYSHQTLPFYTSDLSIVASRFKESFL